MTSRRCPESAGLFAKMDRRPGLRGAGSFILPLSQARLVVSLAQGPAHSRSQSPHSPHPARWNSRMCDGSRLSRQNPPVTAGAVRGTAEPGDRRFGARIELPLAHTVCIVVAEDSSTEDRLQTGAHIDRQQQLQLLSSRLAELSANLGPHIENADWKQSTRSDSCHCPNE